MLSHALDRDGPTLSAADLDLARAFVERVVGRELRPAERVIDILKLDRALNQAKDDLERAIKVAQRRAARRALARQDGRVRLETTRAMLAPLEALFRLGREEALAELRRAGVTPVEPRRQFAHAHPHRRLYHGGAMDALAAKLESGLGKIARKVQDGIVGADLSEASSLAIARELMKIPGGRDLASQLVSVALDRGMALTFDANQDLVSGWEISAILDGSTCDECEAHDGEQYQTWDAIQEYLPDGGPTIYCLGGSRCRCRCVPIGPA